MGLRDAQSALISALREGRYENDAREALAEKNLWAVGEVSAEDVIQLLQRCKGGQYRESAHHWDADTTVFEFRPVQRGQRWYIKAYSSSSTAIFISVHLVGQ